MQGREALLDRLDRGEADGRVLIVGGGINGIGVYRDLALQGVPALLVDAADFSGGTSAAPSRLIHGGLRYLETGEFALVRESVEERNRLLLNAPHQVTPIPVWVPAFSWAGGAFSAALRFLKLKRVPGPKGALVVKLGLLFFDRFGAVNRTMPRHRLVGRAEATGRLPSLPPRVSAVAEYYDARLSSPERLAMEIVGDAEADCPAAMAIPYLAVTGHAGAEVELTDRLTGRVRRIRPSLVVNCAGPWADRADEALGVSQKLIGGTKGSHLVMMRPDIAGRLGDVMLYFETHDHRACLVYALDERRILLGTTDLRTDDPDDMRCSDGEIDYLFRVMEEVLPGSAPERSQIVFAYAGVRPLPKSEAGATGAISRDHTFREFEPTPARPYPLVTLVGGKWTTYRACAEQLVDRILPRLGARRRASTLEVPIGGGRDLPRNEVARREAVRAIAEAGGVPPAAAERLLSRYGTTAQRIAASLKETGRLPLEEAPLYLRGEIEWIAREERVTRLADIVLRRTLMGFEGLTHSGLLAELAGIVGPLLGWSAERALEEEEATRRVLVERHRVDEAGSRAASRKDHVGRAIA